MFIPFGFMNTQAGGGGDADANTYIAAVQAGGGTLSGAEETAIQTFYTDLKAEGLYTQIDEMWMFLGGTATSNAVGGKAVSNLSFQGTWSHSISGSYTAQDLANYADTGYNTSTDPSSGDASSDFHFSAMALGSVNTGYMGNGDTNGTNFCLLGISNGNGEQFMGGGRGSLGIGFTGAGGWMIANRTSSANFKTQRVYTGTLLSNTVTTTYTPYNGNLWFMGRNGSVNSVTSGRMLFGSVGTGMTDVDAQTFADKINDLNTAFSRNIW